MNVIIWLLLIQLFVWLWFIAGLWIVLEVIMQMTLPITGWAGALLTGILRVGSSAALALFWLWIWIRIEYNYFWKEIRKEREKTD